MIAEGNCPKCGATVGVRIADDGVPIPDSTIERWMDMDGNGMYCQTCGEYNDPDGIEVK